MQPAVPGQGTKVDCQPVFNIAPFAALVFAGKRPIDEYDIDASAPYRLDRIGDLDPLASGLLGSMPRRYIVLNDQLMDRVPSR